ncbi:MAG TPA: LytTR family DNA-binding domain-containing protein [Caulobacteraceae bacterium]|jgi:hypothetical protein
MSGAGTSAPLIAYAAFALLLFAGDTVDALSILHDRPALAPWEPFVWEYSSGLMLVALSPAIGWLLRIAPPTRAAWARFALTHGPATLPFSLIHVGGFIALRTLIYAAVGWRYRFGPITDVIYEYRKDVLTYCIILIWLVAAARLATRPAASPSKAPDAATFDIRDGATVIRVRPAEIVTATAAGNYVEFRLADGGRPLMRTTLARVEAALAPHGFVRTHRSWLVNAARLRVLAAEGGSGDYRLELDGGVEAPLSRRFPEALGRLRQPERSMQE